MQTRQTWWKSIAAAVVALSVTVGAVAAAELAGRIKSADADTSKIVVVPNSGGDDVTITVTADTAWERSDGKAYKKRPDFEKLPKRKVTITHENNVASKIVIETKKKKDQ